MTPDQWQQVKASLAAVMTLDVRERAAYLDAVEDPLVREALVDVLTLSGSGTRTRDEAGRPDQATRLPAGTLVGSYRVTEYLGAGGMGEVYKAQDQRLGRAVALKRLPLQWNDYPRRVWRFEREARAASALNHPNIVTVHDVLASPDGRFIVTEYVDGDTLQARLLTGPLDVPSALDAAIQIARGLEVAHGAGIVHRDIKPANIMIRRDGVVKLLDFGVAKQVQPDDEGEPAQIEAGKTMPGVAIGTARYMSPEQARGQHVDHRSDIFSLGLVLYEMIAGGPPFPGPSPTDRLIGLLHSEPEPLLGRVPGLPPTLEHAIGRALRKVPDERYQQARDLRVDLERALRELTGAPAQLGGEPPGTRPRHDSGPTVLDDAPAPLGGKPRFDGQPDANVAPPPAAPAASTRSRLVALATLAAVVAVAGYWFVASRSGQEPAREGASASRDLDGVRDAARRPGGAAHVPKDRPAIGPGVRWVAIPGTGAAGSTWRAEFDMGCAPRDSACDQDERPRRRVTLTRPFALTETEVTVRQYAEYIRATGAEAPLPPSFAQGDDHPVVGVTWAEAAAFCGWLGGRLPTEAEWEHAARGGLEGQTYPWGTAPPSSGGNFAGADDGFEFTAPVASYAPSRYGLYDMGGNAWEWVADWYGLSYEGLATTDPTGGETGDRKVLRGDGWSNPSRNGRLSDRGRNAPDARLAVYGIRCARDVEP